MTAILQERVRAVRVDPPSPEEAIAAVRRIVDSADVILVDGRAYIVAPISPADLNTLAAFEAHDGGEPDDPPEDGDVHEPNGDELDESLSDDTAAAIGTDVHRMWERALAPKYA